jgi:hypothetical protein
MAQLASHGALPALLHRLRITSAFAPSPTRPEPMAMAGRLIQTLFRQWAYAYRYYASDHCIDELAPWDAARQLPSPLLCRQTQPPACCLKLEGDIALKTLRLTTCASHSDLTRFYAPEAGPRTGSGMRRNSFSWNTFNAGRQEKLQINIARRG